MTMIEKRVVLITGASRGIGAATARLLAKHGAAVAVNYVTMPQSALFNEGGCAIAVQADVRVRDEVEHMVKIVDEQLGTIDTPVLDLRQIK
jgi:3-oxoacyl-[acyl-carrier protein] reductase